MRWASCRPVFRSPAPSEITRRSLGLSSTHRDSPAWPATRCSRARWCSAFRRRNWCRSTSRDRGVIYSCDIFNVRFVHLEGKGITDDIEALLTALPPHIQDPLQAAETRDDLLEVVLDLGRRPEARFPGREFVLDEHEVTPDDIAYVVARIGEFGDDNRAGIPRTLHRISAIRNRKGTIVGLTCRIGRAVFGTIGIIRDFVESGKSLLLLGPPGVGKTTMLREVARVLADEFRKRVIVVDTTNEIAGDGDIPHPGIGHARRMQVPTPTLQHAVMIEAVENHMPEVIIIDEIGTELDALAARTIAERGVQLVGTAHGNTLENLMLNPT
ncbi:MAG: AAA family ATPase, partial [Chloroflexi bacterium]|nr:AAA family ATPase [Chloroflexota bacterium]